MHEEIVYAKRVHEVVALYITKHGGKVQTERVDPAHVFHKVTFEYKSYRWIGGEESSPIYKYVLADEGQILVQFSKEEVPGHPQSYWVTIYVYTEKGG